MSLYLLIHIVTKVILGKKYINKTYIKQLAFIVMRKINKTVEVKAIVIHHHLYKLEREQL